MQGDESKTKVLRRAFSKYLVEIMWKILDRSA